LIGQQNGVTLARFQEGYCELFYRTSTSTNANIHFSEPVTSVQSHGFGNIDVITQKRKYNFDTVIFALRPQHLVTLNIFPTQFSSFSRIYYPTTLIQSSVPIDLSQRVNPLSNDVLNAFDPTLGTNQVDLTGKLTGMVASYLDSAPDIWVLIGNSQSGGFSNLNSDLQNFMGAAITNTYFNFTYYEGPNYLKLSDISSFYQWIDSQQGNAQTGFYFIGDYLAGHGVPENFEYALRFFNNYFSNLPPPPTRGHKYGEGEGRGNSGRFRSSRRSLQPHP